jgi:S1-C subfamily serine protease
VFSKSSQVTEQCVILKIRGSHWTSSTNLRLLFVRDFFLTLNKKTGPWKMTTESSSTGTGFIVDNNRILTNAHVVHRGQSILCRPQVSKSSLIDIIFPSKAQWVIHCPRCLIL